MIFCHIKLPFQYRDPTSPDILRHATWSSQFWIRHQAIPRNFGAMFRFNAAVMGVSRQDWMYEAATVQQPRTKEFSGFFKAPM